MQATSDLHGGLHGGLYVTGLRNICGHESGTPAGAFDPRNGLLPRDLVAVTGNDHGPLGREQAGRLATNPASSTGNQRNPTLQPETTGLTFASLPALTTTHDPPPELLSTN